MISKDKMEICISEWLSKDYPEVYASLCDAFNQSNINCQVLTHTKDVWARDYMPLHIGNGGYVTFNYEPDYLVEKNDKYITNQNNVIQDIDLNVVAHLDIVMDGGNVVRCGDKVIMTDKIISENPNIRPLKLIDTIENTLNSELILIPWDMEEPFGHADGMVAYIGDEKLLMNNYVQMGKEADSFRKRLHKILDCHFDVMELSYSGRLRKDAWCYLNYVETPKTIIISGLSKKLDCENDKSAVKVFSEIFPAKKIIQVYVAPLLRYGGALHSVTWELYTAHRPSRILS